MELCGVGRRVLVARVFVVIGKAAPRLENPKRLERTCLFAFEHPPEGIGALPVPTLFGGIGLASGGIIDVAVKRKSCGNRAQA